MLLLLYLIFPFASLCPLQMTKCKCHSTISEMVSILLSYCTTLLSNYSILRHIALELFHITPYCSHIALILHHIALELFHITPDCSHIAPYCSHIAPMHHIALELFYETPYCPHISTRAPWPLGNIKRMILLINVFQSDGHWVSRIENWILILTISLHHPAGWLLHSYSSSLQ